MSRSTRAWCVCLSGGGLWVVLGTAGGCDVGGAPRAAILSAANPVVGVAGAAANSSAREAADRHAGRYRFSGGQAERDAAEVAIEDVVSDMNPFARGIARERLREANPVPEHVVIERDGDAIAIAFDERRYAAPLDGTKTRVEGITGDMLDYHVSITPARIRQTFVGSKGGRRNDLRRRGDRGLTLDVTVTSESLPKPLRYRLTLKRDE